MLALNSNKEEIEDSEVERMIKDADKEYSGKMVQLNEFGHSYNIITVLTNGSTPNSVKTAPVSNWVKTSNNKEVFLVVKVERREFKTRMPDLFGGSSLFAIVWLMNGPELIAIHWRDFKHYFEVVE